MLSFALIALFCRFWVLDEFLAEVPLAVCSFLGVVCGVCWNWLGAAAERSKSRSVLLSSTRGASDMFEKLALGYVRWSRFFAGGVQERIELQWSRSRERPESTRECCYLGRRNCRVRNVSRCSAMTFFVNTQQTNHGLACRSTTPLGHTGFTFPTPSLLRGRRAALQRLLLASRWHPVWCGRLAPARGRATAYDAGWLFRM